MDTMTAQQIRKSLKAAGHDVLAVRCRRTGPRILLASVVQMTRDEFWSARDELAAEISRVLGGQAVQLASTEAGLY